MNTIVIYKSKYGASKTYAKWIGEELCCTVKEYKEIKAEDLLSYDTIIYGGGLYAEIIGGINLITKNFEKLKDKNLIVFTTGITPVNIRDYYDKLVIEKNFKPFMIEKIKIFNFPGKMILEELSFVHRNAIKTLKKIMKNKENPSNMEKLLIDLCDCNGDFTEKDAVYDLITYVKKE